MKISFFIEYFLIIFGMLFTNFVGLAFSTLVYSDELFIVGAIHNNVYVYKKIAILSFLGFLWIFGAIATAGGMYLRNYRMGIKEIRAILSESHS